MKYNIVCNSIVYASLAQLRASGVDNENIPLILDCIGKAFVKMSIANKPIEYYMDNIEKMCQAEKKGDAENE